MSVCGQHSAALQIGIPIDLDEDTDYHVTSFVQNLLNFTLPPSDATLKNSYLEYLIKFPYRVGK